MKTKQLAFARLNIHQIAAFLLLTGWTCHASAQSTDWEPNGVMACYPGVCEAWADSGPWVKPADAISDAVASCEAYEGEPLGCTPGGGNCPSVLMGVTPFYNGWRNSVCLLAGANGKLWYMLWEEKSFALEAPPPIRKDCNDSNPCDAATGIKSQTETDYTSPAEGGLTFRRYYNSKGAYKTAANMAAGWRHTYSRVLNEEADRKPQIFYPEPVDQSDFYAYDSTACTSGWDDIKDTVWSGDLASGTATYLGGSICKITVSSETVAYFRVRQKPGWFQTMTLPSTIKTIARPNGASIVFEYVSSEWVNVLDPSVTLEPSGSDWIYTDAQDTQEVYDSSGRLTEIIQRNGQTETLDYELTVAQGGDDDSATLDRVTGPFGHEITFAYDSNGLLSEVTTPDGTIEYAYDSNENLASVTYPDATVREYLYEDEDLPNHLTGLIDENEDQYATWEYDSAGRAVLSKHAGDMDQVEFAYNGDGSTTLTLGNLAERTYEYTTEQGERKLSALTGDVCGKCPDGNVQEKTYDSDGFPDEVTDWEGNVTKTERNSRGLTETLTEAYGASEGRETTITWHSTYRLPTEISRPTHDIEYSYDSSGNPTTVTITDGSASRTWTMTYNSYGQVLTINGPRTDVTDVTTFDYYDCTTGDECGQLESVTNALSQETTYDAYDASGRLTQMTDPNGLETSFTYDDRGNMLTVTQTPTAGEPRVTTFTYDDAGQLATAEMPNGLELSYSYSAAHYLTSVTDNLGNHIDYDYDAMGNLEDEDTYNSGSTLKRAIDYAYDLNYHLESITNGGFETELTFDDVGNLTDVTDPELAYTQHSYDALNRLDQTIDALSGVISYEYDAHGNLTSVTAANGANTTYEYDNLDNLTEEDSPDRGTITYTHDAAGNVATMTDARNKVTTYTYDELNRLTEIELDNEDTITFQYDTGTNATGRLNKITDPSGQTTWTYDNFGAVTQKAQIIGSVTLTTEYEYDDEGRLTVITLPSGKEVTYGYSDHLPVSVTVDTTTILSGATYDPFGPVNGWTWGNSTSHSRGFSTRGLLTSQSMVTDTRTLTYDDAGRPVTLDDARHDLSFDYNALGQITDFTASGSAPLPASQDFTYDENGNRETLVQDSTTYNYSITAYTNRLASTTGPTAKTFTYDAAGNVTGDNIHTYAYDDWGRLVSVDSGAVTYEHNGQGQRVKKDDGSDEILFAYDESGALIGEYDDSGTAIQETVWFNGAPVAVLVGTDEYYVHTDHLGTPRIITDGNTVIWRWESDPFGTTAAQEDPDGDQTDFTYNLRFPGQYFDEETGIHYNYFRDYDAATGRYLESDPIGNEGGLNTYAYVDASPLIAIDYYGLSGTIALPRPIIIPRPTPFPIPGQSVDPIILPMSPADIGLVPLVDVENPYTGELEQCPRNCKGLLKQIWRHEEKLRRYIQDPYGNDNLGFLYRAFSESRRSSIITGRIRNLENQIRNLREQYQECLRKHGNMA